eukprot:364988-Chlamydomonas_euryale.AAC.11
MERRQQSGQLEEMLGVTGWVGRLTTPHNSEPRSIHPDQAAPAHVSKPRQLQRRRVPRQRHPCAITSSAILPSSVAVGVGCRRPAHAAGLTARTREWHTHACEAAPRPSRSSPAAAAPAAAETAAAAASAAA